MDLIQIVILSLIQGLTEFLPISSSAHLILPSKLLGWEDQGVAFDVACHVGTLLAVILFYFDRLKKITADWFKSLKSRQQTADSRLGWFIIISTIPVCLAGLLLNHLIEEVFRDKAEIVIAITTVSFGILLWIADVYCRKKQNAVTVATMPLVIAVAIGLSQILAFVPGTSRSGISITVALFLGLTRKDAADYSFLLSIPLIMAAGCYSGLKVAMSETTGAADPLSMLLGIVLSFISAYIVIKLFIRYISRIGMTPFVIYRLLLGGILFYVVLTAAGGA
jgi:undecaprenyl-diphosphatase